MLFRSIGVFVDGHWTVESYVAPNDPVVFIVSDDDGDESVDGFAFTEASPD